MNNTQRITAVEGRLDALEVTVATGFDKLAMMIGALSPNTPAAVVPAAPAPKPAPKKRSTTRRTSKAPAKTVTLTKATRLDFIEAHDWAVAGLSTFDLAIAVVKLGQPLAAGYTVGAMNQDRAGRATRSAVAYVRSMIA